MKQLSRKSTLPNVNEQKHLEACIIRSGCIPFDERVAVCSQRYQTLMASQSQAEYNNSSTTAICSTEDVSLVMTISCVISITHCFERKKKGKWTELLFMVSSKGGWKAEIRSNRRFSMY